MAGERFVTPVWQAFDDNGDPLPGAKLFFYENGTTNFKDTFADVDLTNQNPNPIDADGAGRFVKDIFLQNSSYRVDLTDADNVLIWSKNDVNNVTTSTVSSLQPDPGAVWLFFGTQAQLDVYLANGWFVMDGNNGTINLDEQFIKCTINVAGLGVTGGNEDITPTGTVASHTLTVAEIPAHTHDLRQASVVSTAGGSVRVTDGSQPDAESGSTGGGGGHSHGLTMDMFDNQPQFTQLIPLYFPGV